MPRISESFTVDRPLTQVWALIQDVPQVVTCLPGLALVEQPAPNAYRGRMKIKLGAVSAAFEGEATILETDEVHHRTRISGKGVDKKGGSRATADFSYALSAGPTGTTVNVEADINLSGPLAQFGRTSILNDVAHELTAQFAQNLSAKLTASSPLAMDAAVETAPATELDAGKIARSILRRRWRGFMQWLRSLFGMSSA
jgi:carbon monoxide dehydrogenase subunit G